MAKKINVNQVILEASILFVSIFTTLSVIFSAVSSDFKFIYFYLGYMLYYSLPFILSVFFGVISMIIEDNSAKLSQIIVQIQTAFFLTGLMTTLLLATSAAGSALLPLDYITSYSYAAVCIVEVLIFLLFFMGLLWPVDYPISSPSIKSLNRFMNWLIGEKKVKYLHRKKTKDYFKGSLAILLVFGFIIGIIFMSTLGFSPIVSTVESGHAFLTYTGPINLTLCRVVHANFEVADRVELKLAGENNNYFFYYLYDEPNFAVLSDANMTGLPSTPLASGFGSNLDFNTVINSTGSYYFVLKGISAEGANVTYSLSTLKIDNTYQRIYLMLSSASVAIFILTVRSMKPKKQTAISQFGK